MISFKAGVEPNGNILVEPGMRDFELYLRQQFPRDYSFSMTGEEMRVTFLNTGNLSSAEQRDVVLHFRQSMATFEEVFEAYGSRREYENHIFDSCPKFVSPPLVILSPKWNRNCIRFALEYAPHNLLRSAIACNDKRLILELPFIPPSNAEPDAKRYLSALTHSIITQLIAEAINHLERDLQEFLDENHLEKNLAMITERIPRYPGAATTTAEERMEKVRTMINNYQTMLPDARANLEAQLTESRKTMYVHAAVTSWIMEASPINCTFTETLIKILAMEIAGYEPI